MNVKNESTTPSYEWVWKPIAAIMVPLAVATIPLVLAWFSSDRGVDRVIITSAFDILKNDPEEYGGLETRKWAIRVVEKYSGENFTDAEKQELENNPLPISQSAKNPMPLMQNEMTKAIQAAKSANNSKLLMAAKSEIGVREFIGKASNPRIDQYNISADLGHSDDVPWNSQFINWVVKKAGYTGTNDGRSRSWQNWGKSVEDEVGEKLIEGCVAVLWRRSPKDWSGIVGLYLGEDKNGKIRILGGNLYNAVDAGSFEKNRLLTCRLPDDWKRPAQ